MKIAQMMFKHSALILKVWDQFKLKN